MAFKGEESIFPYLQQCHSLNIPCIIFIKA